MKNFWSILFNKKNFPVICICSAFSLIVLFGVRHLAFYADEIFTFSVASKGPENILDFLSRDISAPLYYLLYAPYIKLVDVYGSHPQFFLRLPSFVAGLLSIPIFYSYCGLWIRRPEALVVTSYYSFSYILVNYSGLARFYSFILLLTVASLYFLEKFIRSKRILWLYLFCATSIANVYTHYYAIIYFISYAAYLLYALSDDRNKSPVDHGIRKHVTLSLVASFFIITPLLILITQQSGSLLAYDHGTGWLTWRIRSIGSTLLQFCGTRNHHPLFLLFIPALFVVTAGFLSIRRSLGKKFHYLCLFSIAFFMFSLLMPTRPLGSRYFIGFFPLFAMALGAGVTNIGQHISIAHRNILKRALLLVLMLPSLYSIFIFMFVQKAALECLDFKALAGKYSRPFLLKPYLITNYEDHFMGGRFKFQEASISYYLYRREKPIEEQWESKIFDKRFYAKNIADHPKMVFNKPVLTVVYVNDLDQLHFGKQGWDTFGNHLLVKLWPPGTRAETIFDDFTLIPIRLDMGNL